MLTATEIGEGRDGLGEYNLNAVDQLALVKLVRRYSRYHDNKPLYPDLALTVKATIDAAIAIGSTDEQKALAKALGAVLRKLETLPGFVIQAFGSDQRPADFSSNVNWQELAQDVLDTLYDPQTVTQIWLGTVDRRFPEGDEMIGTTWPYWRYRRPL